MTLNRQSTQCEHVTEHHQLASTTEPVICESTREHIDRDHPEEHHAQTIVPDKHDVQQNEPIHEHHEPAVEADHAVQDTDIKELHHEAEQQKPVGEHNEEALGHAKPTFHQHQNATAPCLEKAEDHVSPSEDAVRIHEEYHESERPIVAGKFLF